MFAIITHDLRMSFHWDMQARRRKSDSLLLTASRQFHVLCMDCCFFFLSLSFSSRMYGLSSFLALDIHFAEKIWMQIQSLFTYSFKSTRTKKKRCGSIWTNRNKSLQGLHHKINQHTYFFFSNRYIFIFRLMQMRRSNSLFFFTFVVLFFAFVRIVSSPFLFTAQKNKRPEYFRVYEHLFG